MYTSVTNQAHKEMMILFTKPSQLRLVTATIAFGLGIDCLVVLQVIHVGIPEDCESYIQDTGHAGSDGKAALAMYHHCERNIKDYVENNSQCIRDYLYQFIGSYEHEQVLTQCLFCDMCFSVCLWILLRKCFSIVFVGLHIQSYEVITLIQLNVYLHVISYNCAPIAVTNI